VTRGKYKRRKECRCTKGNNVPAKLDGYTAIKRACFCAASALKM
jgi:hypothetical protein